MREKSATRAFGTAFAAPDDYGPIENNLLVGPVKVFPFFGWERREDGGALDAKSGLRDSGLTIAQFPIIGYNELRFKGRIGSAPALMPIAVLLCSTGQASMDTKLVVVLLGGLVTLVGYFVSNGLERWRTIRLRELEFRLDR